MIDKILYCVGIAMLFTAFFSLTQVPKWIDFKPFNCGVCLSFWTCIVTLPFTDLLPYVLYLGWAGYAAYFSMILKRIMYKI